MRRTLLAAALFLAVPTVPTPLSAQEGDLPEYQRGLAFRMLKRVRQEIERSYFDPRFNGKNLDEMDYRAQRSIESATTRAQAFGAVAQFVADLGDSHTRFFPPGLTVAPNYGWEWTMVGDDCFVMEVGKGSDAARKGLRPGDKVLAIDGLKPTRESIRVIWYVYHFLQPRQRMSLWVERPDGTKGEVLFEARLLGHFFPDSFPAFTQQMRDSTTQFMIRPRGGDPYAGQVILLVGSESASAAEIAARVLQMKGRAMIVGDRTAGLVVGSRYLGLVEQASDHAVPYTLQVSFIDALMPDSTRLEGAGVIPNVPALPTGRDLAEGRDPAMQFALEMAGIRMTPEDAGKIWK